MLADCAAFLGREECDIETLADEAELLPALLARIGLVLTRSTPLAPRREAAAQFYTALAAGWGRKEFVAAELLAWCTQRATPTQRDMLAAITQLCSPQPGAEVTPQKLGIALRSLEREPPAAGMHVERCGDRRGAARWRLRD